MIASHYAEPLPRPLAGDGVLHASPGGDQIGTLRLGEVFKLLDCTGGWAWGYDPEGRVGYVRGDLLGC